MKNNQKGFGAVEGMLLIIIVLLVGFIGYYVYHTRNNTNTTYNNAANSANSSANISPKNTQTYQGGGYTLQYPKDWKFVAKGTTVNGGEFATDEFLPTANYPDNNAFILMLDHDTTSLSLDQYVKNLGPAEGVVSQQVSKINGYDAFTENYKVPGPSGVPEGYEVVVEHNGKVVIFNYTKDQNYTETYKSIINSIKFSN